MADAGKDHECCSRQALLRCRSVDPHRKDPVFLGPRQRDRTWQRVKRRYAFRCAEQVIGDIAPDQIADGIDGLLGGEPFGVRRDIPHADAAHRCPAKGERGQRLGSVGEAPKPPDRAGRVRFIGEPGVQKPAGDNAHTERARPRRASSIAIQPPIELPAMWRWPSWVRSMSG